MQISVCVTALATKRASKSVGEQQVWFVVSNPFTVRRLKRHMSGGGVGVGGVGP